MRMTPTCRVLLGRREHVRCLQTRRISRASRQAFPQRRPYFVNRAGYSHGDLDQPAQSGERRGRRAAAVGFASAALSFGATALECACGRRRNLGTFSSRAAAEKHERAVRRDQYLGEISTWSSRADVQRASKRDCCRRPGGQVLIRSIDTIDRDDDFILLSPHGKAVEIAGRMTRGVDPVWRVPRIVF